MMDKENLHREKEQAYMKGYEDGAEKMRDFMREQLATANLNCEKALHEGYLQGKHEEEMDRVFGGIEAIKPTKTPTNTPTDLISRQEAIDMLYGMITDATSHGITPRLDPYYVIHRLEYLPPAEPERPKGEWVIHGEPPWYVRECTKCGSKWFHHVSDDKPNFCANCGADMRGEKDE